MTTTSLLNSNVVYAIYNFEAENEDEIAFQCGEPIVILEKDDKYMDGWRQGCNIQGETGLFPVNYTSPCKPNFQSAAENRLLYKDELCLQNRISLSETSCSNSSFEERSRTSTPALSALEPQVSLDQTSNSETYSKDSARIISWGVEEVTTWLKSVGLESISDSFIEQEITGDVLLELDHSILKELGIAAYGRRFKILNAVKSLKDTSREQNSVEAVAKDRHSAYTNLVSSNSHDHLANIAPSSNSSVQNLVLPHGNSSSYPLNRSLSVASKSESNSNSNNHYGRKNRNSDNRMFSASVSQSNVSSTSTKRSTYDVLAHRIQHKQLVQPQTHRNTYSADKPKDSTTNQQKELSVPEHKGWLYKQSDTFKTWNKRWYVICGTSLYYFKNQKDNKVKSTLCLEGYRLIIESSNNLNSNRHAFRLHHDRERTFYFYTNDLNEMKKWVQLLMKATIKRDLGVPVVSSSIVSCVTLETAQKMMPRPPSSLIHGKNSDNYNMQNHSLTSSSTNRIIEEESDQTLLQMGDSRHAKEPFQNIFIKSTPTLFDKKNEYAIQEEEEEEEEEEEKEEKEKEKERKEKEEKEEDEEEEEEQKADTGEDIYFDQPPNRSILYGGSRYLDNAGLLVWVNSRLPPSNTIKDLSQSFCSGEPLIQLLESTSKKTITRSKNQMSFSMAALDNIVECFKFMNNEGIKNTGYSIKDVYSGNEDKIIEMIHCIKNWVEEAKGFF